MFFRSRGDAPKRVQGSAEVVAIFAAANESAERLGLRAKPGAKLRRADVQVLIDALNAYPGYGH